MIVWSRVLLLALLVAPAVLGDPETTSEQDREADRTGRDEPTKRPKRSVEETTADLGLDTTETESESTADGSTTDETTTDVHEPSAFGSSIEDPNASSQLGVDDLKELLNAYNVGSGVSYNGGEGRPPEYPLHSGHGNNSTTSSTTTTRPGESTQPGQQYSGNSANNSNSANGNENNNGSGNTAGGGNSNSGSNGSESQESGGSGSSSGAGAVMSALGGGQRLVQQDGIDAAGVEGQVIPLSATGGDQDPRVPRGEGNEAEIESEGHWEIREIPPRGDRESYFGDRGFHGVIVLALVILAGAFMVIAVATWNRSGRRHRRNQPHSRRHLSSPE